MDDRDQGLYEKYNVVKVDGEPAAEGSDYFVLNIGTDFAAIDAAMFYARLIKASHPALSTELTNRCIGNKKELYARKHAALSKDMEAIAEAEQALSRPIVTPMPPAENEEAIEPPVVIPAAVVPAAQAEPEVIPGEPDAPAADFSTAAIADGTAPVTPIPSAEVVEPVNDPAAEEVSIETANGMDTPDDGGEDA